MRVPDLSMVTAARLEFAIMRGKMIRLKQRQHWIGVILKRVQLSPTTAIKPLRLG